MLKEEFGVESGPSVHETRRRLLQRDMDLDEDKAPVPARYEYKATSNEGQGLASVHGTTNARARQEVSSRVEGSTYFEDSHRVTPKGSPPTRGRRQETFVEPRKKW